MASTASLAYTHCNCDRRKERVYDQGISHAVIEVFHGMYTCYHLVGITCRSRKYRPMQAEGIRLSECDIEQSAKVIFEEVRPNFHYFRNENLLLFVVMLLNCQLSNCFFLWGAKWQQIQITRKFLDTVYM